MKHPATVPTIQVIVEKADNTNKTPAILPRPPREPSSPNTPRKSTHSKARPGRHHPQSRIRGRLCRPCLSRTPETEGLNTTTAPIVETKPGTHLHVLRSNNRDSMPEEIPSSKWSCCGRCCRECPKGTYTASSASIHSAHRQRAEGEAGKYLTYQLSPRITWRNSQRPPYRPRPRLCVFLSPLNVQWSQMEGGL